MIKFILKTVLANFFKGFVKTIKWIVIGIFFLGMLVGFPLVLLIIAIRKRKRDKENRYYE